MSARHRLDVPWQIPVLSSLLVVLGLLFVRSSTQGTQLEGLERRQLLMIGAALPALLLFGSLSHRRLARLAFPLYALGLGALLLVPWIGTDVGGARRWFRLPFEVQLQPSELMKPLLVLALARWLEFRRPPTRLVDLLGPLLLIGAPFVLIKLEPDLGTALLLLPIGVAMLWYAGARKLHFLGGAALVATLVPVIYFSPILAEYQKERVRTFLESVPDVAAKALEAHRTGAAGEADRLERELVELKRGSGYQSHCAQTSIGSGGLFGKGLGQGPQNRLSYLPARHTDFIFAVIAEEWGLLGGGAVLLLFVLLGLSFLSVAAGTRDRFSQLVSVGAAASLVIQAFANVAMASGLMPVTGIPLPFVSQGGSSILSSLLLLGLVIAASRSRRDGEPFLYRANEPSDPFHARAAAGPLRDGSV